MTELVSEVENAPATYPDISSLTLSNAAFQLEEEYLWQRIEAWCDHRWTERVVFWVVNGPGDFEPLLTPAEVTSTETWTGATWAGLTLDASPLGGYQLPSSGPYRFTATVGADNPAPSSVLEAFRRLAEYSAEPIGIQGASRWTKNFGGYERTVERTPSWIARGLQQSGAADLLRPWRRNV